MKKFLQASTLTLALFLILFFTIFPACRKNTSVSRIPGGLNVKVLSDVKYGSNKDWQGKTVDLLLDLYMPVTSDQSQKFPLILFVHGGGFQTGDKGFVAPYMKAFASSGYVAASINYRLGWTGGSDCSGDTTEQKEAAYRAIQDMNAALRFVVAHAGEYLIDTNYIFLSGNSAGAVTVLNGQFLTQAQINAILPGAQNKLGGINDADNSLTNSYTVKGVAAVSGCLIDSNVINSSNAVPLILFHGGQDDVVPYNHGHAHDCPNMLMVDGSLSIYNRLVALVKPCVLHFDPLQGHMPFSDDFRFDNELCFFNGVVGERVQDGLYMGDASSCP